MIGNDQLKSLCCFIIVKCLTVNTIWWWCLRQNSWSVSFHDFGVLSTFVFKISDVAYCVTIPETRIPARLGTDARLSCYSDSVSGIEWTVHNSLYTDARIFYIDIVQETFKHRVTASIGQGHYNITIHNVKSDDDGNYTCKEVFETTGSTVRVSVTG